MGGGVKICMVAAAIAFGIGALITWTKEGGLRSINWTDAGLCLWTVAWILGH